MPTYEYRCNACNREFEFQQRMSDPDLVKCEVCGEDKLEKLISRTAFQLKGSGWYKDLYSSKPAEAIKGSVDKGKPSSSDSAPAAPAAPAAASSSSDSGGGGGGSSSGGSGGGSSSGGGTGGGSSGSSTPAASGS